LSKGKVSVKWIGFTEVKDPRKKYSFGKEYQGGYRKIEGMTLQAIPSVNQQAAQQYCSNQLNESVASNNRIGK
jgi:hypothetical protein